MSFEFVQVSFVLTSYDLVESLVTLCRVTFGGPLVTVERPGLGGDPLGTVSTPQSCLRTGPEATGLRRDHRI